MSESEYTQIYVTTASEEEAHIIVHKLLEARLVACVNMIPNVTSLYHWEEKITQDSECIMIAKTTTAMTQKAIDLIKQYHSYECPCILTLPILGGFQDYLSWIKTETRNLKKHD